MKKWHSTSLVLAVLIGAALVLYQTHQADGSVAKGQPNSHTDIPQVKVVTASADSADAAFYTFNVRLEPIEEAMLYARANGYVEEWFADIGTYVEQGQVLAKLSLPELEDQINQVKAEINSQEAEVALAKTLKDRVASLIEGGAVSKTEVDQRNANYKVAVATRDALKARLSQLEKEFAYTTIQAPFSGIITMRNINRGDRITVNDTTPLYRIINADKLRIVTDVPQSQLSGISLETPADLSFADRPSETFKADFRKKSNEVDIASGTMRVEFILDNKDLNLPSGLSAKLAVPTKTGQAKWLPVNTVKVGDGDAFLMTVDKDNTVKRTKVVAGRFTGDKVEILSGLNGDEQVIINPNALLKTGDKVEIAKDPAK